MEGILLDTMFNLPSLEGVEEVVISREVVEGTARPAGRHHEYPTVRGTADGSKST
jgi:ATP-dependent protease Clp ATPase subunit